MKDLVKRLITLNFADYKAALSEMRDALDSGKKLEKIEDGEFFFILRPYCWFLHDPGFQDILDVCEDAMQVIIDHEKLLIEETNPITGNEYMAVGSFLASYLDTGDYNPSAWKSLFSSPEIAIHVAAEKYSEKLETKDAEAAAQLKKLSNIFMDLEGCKHLTYYILRHLGADYIDFFGVIIHRFPSPDQTYILHALDAFPKNTAVANFYKQYIATASSDYLREVAEKYAATV